MCQVIPNMCPALVQMLSIAMTLLKLLKDDRTHKWELCWCSCVLNVIMNGMNSLVLAQTIYKTCERKPIRFCEETIPNNERSRSGVGGIKCAAHRAHLVNACETRGTMNNTLCSVNNVVRRMIKSVM